MALKIQGNLTVDAPRADVWKILFDTDALKQIMNKIPGVSVARFERTADDKYEGAATIGVAMIKGKYEGAVTIVEQRALEYLKLRGEGKGGGNWLGGEVALTLADQEGKTFLTYEGSGNVNGPLASLGQRMIDTVGKQFIANGSKALAEELSARAKRSS